MFSLVPEVVPLLCQALMAGIAGAYVLSLPRKTRSAWWLAAVFGGNTLFAVSYLLTVMARADEWAVRLNLGLYAGVAIAAFAAVRLSYTFLARPFRREERVVAWAFGGGLAALLGASVYAAFTVGSSWFLGLLYAYGVYLVVAAMWALWVHLRQVGRFRSLAGAASPRSVERRSGALGHGILAGLVGLMLALSVINALATFGAISLQIIQVASLVIELVIVVGLVVAFINHAPEPTTVQAKLVGVALGVVLALLGLTSMALQRPGEIAAAAGSTVPAEAAVRFAPEADGGYRAAPGEVAFPTGGTPLDLQPTEPGGVWGQARVALPFPVSVGGTVFREVTVAHGPYLALGAPEPCTDVCVGVGPSLDHPVVLAYLLPLRLDDASWPTVTASEDRLDVVWTRIGLDGRTTEHRATLWADGRVEIAYRGLEQHPRAGLAGFHPGGPGRLDVPFIRALPASVPPGTALVDRYGDRFEALAHARTARMIPLVLGATGFVLLLVPLFLRRGVLGPLAALLAGVERIHRGERDVRLVAGANDEFGTLTRRFNTMTASLGTAEQRLREYAGRLEDRVAERTRELRAANADLAEKRDALATSLAELKAAQDRLVQAEKQASLGRLTSGIAHEIKNPLNFVNNFAGLSREAVEDLRAALADGDAEEVEDLLDVLSLNTEKIEAHGLRADQIVQGMMLHARGPESEHSPTNVNDLLRIAAEGVARAYTDRAGGDGLAPIELDLDPEVGEVPVAPEGVLQVAASLLDNALYATTHTEAAGPVRLSSRRTGDAIEVRVADGGGGMDPETAAHVFEPFFTTKPPGEGTGLGLSLAYDIVTAGHGGEITVDSRLGEGTTFTVRLPAEA